MGKKERGCMHMHTDGTDLSVYIACLAHIICRPITYGEEYIHTYLFKAIFFVVYMLFIIFYHNFCLIKSFKDLNTEF